MEQLENTMRTGISPNGQVLTQRNYNDLAGYQVTAPGETDYNYTLLSLGLQNKPLNIFANSTTTSAPTKLSDFLESNMGCVFWAACTQAVPYIPLK